MKVQIKSALMQQYLKWPNEKVNKIKQPTKPNTQNWLDENERKNKLLFGLKHKTTVNVSKKGKRYL